MNIGFLLVPYSTVSRLFAELHLISTPSNSARKRAESFSPTPGTPVEANGMPQTKDSALTNGSREGRTTYIC
jgi:hypothetical protein